MVCVWYALVTNLVLKYFTDFAVISVERVLYKCVNVTPIYLTLNTIYRSLLAAEKAKAKASSLMANARYVTRCITKIIGLQA